MSLRIDGEKLPEAACEGLDAHLAACHACEVWCEEEAERSARLKACLGAGLSDERRFEAAVIAAAKQAGWDGKTLEFPRYGLRRKLASWRNSIVMFAAAVVALAVVGLKGIEWWHAPDPSVASRSVEGTAVAPLGRILTPPPATPLDDTGVWQVRGRDARGEGASGGLQVVPDTAGRPVGVRFTSSSYRYRFLPQRAGDAGLELDLERIEPVLAPLTSWPYQ